MRAVASALTLSTPLVRFAHRHDELPWFRVSFTVATVTASIVFNLGIFAALVAAHMGLDVLKYRTRHGLSWRHTAQETLRESLVDIFFIALGILLAVAFHRTIAIAGIGRLAEAEVFFLNLVLRVGPRLKIAENILEVVTYWKHHFAGRAAPLTPLTKGERWCCRATAAVVLCIALIPLLRMATWRELGSIAQHELTPRLEFGITETLEHIRQGDTGKRQ